MLASMHTVKKQNNLMEKHCYLFQFKKYAKAVLGDVLNLNLFQQWMYIEICLFTEPLHLQKKTLVKLGSYIAITYRTPFTLH